MRLQRSIHVSKPVAAIRLRITARDLPSSEVIDITDVQLQAGTLATGVSPNVVESGTAVGRSQWRNGVIHDGMEIVALANIDRATPAAMRVTAPGGEARVGAFRFGHVEGHAEVDGRLGIASQGWGRAPIITQRSDLYLRTQLEGRAHLRLEWEDRTPGD